MKMDELFSVIVLPYAIVQGVGGFSTLLNYERVRVREEVCGLETQMVGCYEKSSQKGNHIL